MSHLYDPFVPGTLVQLQRNETPNRIRREPVLTSGSADNTTAWLAAGDLFVVLKPPAGWNQPYPHQAGGFVWLYVYAPKAKDEPGLAPIENVVGWTAAGPTNAATAEDRFVDPANPAPFAQ
jgi:hypothetical protein